MFGKLLSDTNGELGKKTERPVGGRERWRV